MKYCSLAFNELRIDPPRLARQMGYADGQLPSNLEALVEEVLEEAVPLCDIRYAFHLEKEFSFEKDAHLLILAGGACFALNKVIFRQLCDAGELLFFVCTAGRAVGRWAAQLASAGDPLLSYVVDALGSVMAEEAADIMHRRVRGRMAVDNKAVTNRYSPGYCGWPVTDQAQLFSLFPQDICGVTLSAASLMDPIKSISGVIGIGEKVVHTPYTCKSCVPEQCPHFSGDVSSDGR